MKDVDWLSQLKLRAGYGLTGNQDAIEAYNSLALMSPNGVTSVNGNSTATYGLHVTRTGLALGGEKDIRCGCGRWYPRWPLYVDRRLVYFQDYGSVV